jgi:hypothetical protein
MLKQDPRPIFDDVAPDLESVMIENLAPRESR